MIILHPWIKEAIKFQFNIGFQFNSQHFNRIQKNRCDT